MGGIPPGATQNMLRDEFSKVGEAGKVHGLPLVDGDGCTPMFDRLGAIAKDPDHCVS